jgi:hypothetical protein
MLGRKNYTHAEIDTARIVIERQLAAYDQVVAKSTGTARDEFDAIFFNQLLLALDRPFVHRIRPVTGKDGNPLNEVEMLCDSLMNHAGVLQASKVIKLVPSTSVTGIEFGASIQLDRDQFGRVATAFFDELQTRFL